jgi:DNA-binding XRE family transcriptional regulator
MATKTDATTSQQAAAWATQAEFRTDERSIRDALECERQEQGTIATTDVPTDPEDAVATTQFIGGLRRHREQAGLSLGDVADQSGLDKVTLSRLENGWYPNPMLNTVARYSRGIGKRLLLDLED